MFALLALGLLATATPGARAASSAPSAPKIALYGVNCSGVSSYYSLVSDSGLKVFNQGGRTISLEAAIYGHYRSSDGAWCGDFEMWHSAKCSGSPCVGLTVQRNTYVQQSDGSWLSVQSGSWNIATAGVTETRTVIYAPHHCPSATRGQTSVSGTGFAQTPSEFC